MHVCLNALAPSPPPKKKNGDLKTTIQARADTAPHVHRCSASKVEAGPKGADIRKTNPVAFLPALDDFVYHGKVSCSPEGMHASVVVTT